MDQKCGHKDTSLPSCLKFFNEMDQACGHTDTSSLSRLIDSSAPNGSSAPANEGNPYLKSLMS